MRPGAPPPAKCACPARDALSGLSGTDVGPGTRMDAVAHVAAISGLEQFGGAGLAATPQCVYLEHALHPPRLEAVPAPAGRTAVDAEQGVGRSSLRRGRRRGCCEWTRGRRLITRGHARPCGRPPAGRREIALHTAHMPTCGGWRMRGDEGHGAHFGPWPCGAAPPPPAALCTSCRRAPAPRFGLRAPFGGLDVRQPGCRQSPTDITRRPADAPAGFT